MQKENAIMAAQKSNAIVLPEDFYSHLSFVQEQRGQFLAVSTCLSSLKTLLKILDFPHIRLYSIILRVQIMTPRGRSSSSILSLSYVKMISSNTLKSGPSLARGVLFVNLKERCYNLPVKININRMSLQDRSVSVPHWSKLHQLHCWWHMHKSPLLWAQHHCVFPGCVALAIHSSQLQTHSCLNSISCIRTGNYTHYTQIISLHPCDKRKNTSQSRYINPPTDIGA